MGQLIMATELTVQSERAFQKQPHIFTNPKAKVTKRSKRWVKDVGLGFKTPKTAIEANYIDKKCPFTGTVSIRGKILAGTLYPPRCTEPLSSEESTCTMFQNTTDTRRDTRTWLLTFLQSLPAFQVPRLPLMSLAKHHFQNVPPQTLQRRKLHQSMKINRLLYLMRYHHKDQK